MTAPLEAVALVRRITEHAYTAGASLVTTIFSDEESTLMRYRHGRDEGFDTAPAWLYEGMAEAYKKGAARLAIVGEDPSLLAKEDPDKVSRANRARSKAYMPALNMIAGFDINWTIVSAATPGLGQDRVSRTIRRKWPSPSCGRRSSRPPASTRLIRSPPGRRTTRRSRRARGC